MKNIFQLLNDHHVEASVLTTEPAYPNKNLYQNQEFWDDEDLNGEQKKIIRIPLRTTKFANHLLSRLFFYLEIMVRFLGVLWKERKNSYDYMYVSTPPIFIVFSAIIGKMFNRTKLILEVRDLWPDSLIGVNKFNHPFIIHLFRSLEKMMYKHADFIVINSMGFKQHIRKLLTGRKTPIVYLPNGARLSEIVNAKDSNGEFRVVYTGNIGLAQDVERLKTFSKKLHERGIRFDVIGYGIWTEQFTAFLKENNLTNVRIRKPTTRKKSLELIESSDVAIAFLNDKEVFSTVLPGKVIDYMTCKTPIIAGVKGVAAKTILENNTGFVFERNNVQGMVDTIEHVRRNPHVRKRLEENCLAAVKREFLWDENIKHLLEIIK